MRIHVQFTVSSCPIKVNKKNDYENVFYLQDRFIIIIYYTSPEICLYKSNMLDISGYRQYPLPLAHVYFPRLRLWK